MLSLPVAASAQSNISLQDWLNIFVDSCVGAGSSFVASGSLDAGGDINLKKINLNGRLAGNITLAKSEYRLLSEGISNKMSTVAADQADKVRVCLEPVRKNLLRAMTLQMDQQAKQRNPFAPQQAVHILSPEEEAVMKYMAVTPGMGGRTGKLVPYKNALAALGMSDIRLRSTLKMLQEKLLVSELSGYLSLFDTGDEYVLEMGYAK